MENGNLKKRKTFLSIKTHSNLIDQESQKMSFFNDLYLSLNENLELEHYEYLMNHILCPSNHQTEAKESKLLHRRVSTETSSNNCELADIDPGIFRQASLNRLANKQSEAPNKLSAKNMNCMATPKPLSKQIVFKNKRVFDLDKKLDTKFQEMKKQLTFDPYPSILNKKPQTTVVKTRYDSMIKKSSSKKYKHSNILSEQQPNQKAYDSRDIRTSFAKSKLKAKENRTQIPKSYLIKAMIYKKSQNQSKQAKSMFSDLKLSNEYRKCFS